MILNAVSGNRYPLERELRDVCIQGGKNTSLFAVLDMCKGDPIEYPGLTYRVRLPGKKRVDEKDPGKISDAGF